MGKNVLRVSDEADKMVRSVAKLKGTAVAEAAESLIASGYKRFVSLKKWHEKQASPATPKKRAAKPRAKPEDVAAETIAS